MIIEVSPKNSLFLECLSSTRIEIINLLNERPYNIKELAELLNLSSGIVTRHVTKLNEAGIVKFQSVNGKRGMQKICSLAIDEVTLKFKVKEPEKNQYKVSIPVGQYFAYSAAPTCGLSTHMAIIGEVDEPRCFADPLHIQASHLWLASGYLDYRIPNYLKEGAQLKSIEISFEIGSEAPRFNDEWPSEISFMLNDTPIGSWVSPGDYGKYKGTFTPSWWAGSQYGLLKTIVVDQSGTHIDGLKISDMTTDHLMITDQDEIKFRLSSDAAVSEQAQGFNLFGRNFGNYNQDIEVFVTY